jgi:hypothetical protein
MKLASKNFEMNVLTQNISMSNLTFNIHVPQQIFSDPIDFNGKLLKKDTIFSDAK